MALADAKTPEQVERQLMELVPRKDWIGLAHILIHHGRAVCRAKSPDCEKCVVGSLCPKLGVRAKVKAEKKASTKRPLRERIAAARKK
jgi:endonuclease-3